MKIKKFIGENEQEIMHQIKDELGSSAIILNIKKTKSNWFLRFFKKDQIEITAAIDTDTGLKSDPPYVCEKSGTNNSKAQMESLIYNHLIQQEVKEEVAQALLKGVEKLEENCDIKEIIRIVYSNICETIGLPDTIDQTINSNKQASIVFFIGPTGVGKTTSIAKLTADFSLRQQKKVALITADTYRIAAIDQLRTYAEILSVPLKVTYSKEELSEGIKQFKNKELIFIDTAGRSHKNKEQLAELKEMLMMFPEKKVYLVLSATTKFKDLMSVVNKYETLKSKYSIIITKTDETTSVGNILNLKYYTKQALSYVSFGQNVPDDIKVISGGEYAKMLLGSLDDE